MPDIQNLSPKAVKPLTLLNKTNEVIDALNENLNSSYAEQNPVLTSVEGICTWTVTHNLGTEDVSCTVYEGDKEIITDKEITSENVVTISINSSSNIPAETYSTLILVKGGIGSGGEGGGSGDITVDSSLSTSSTNPVQNRIITNALNNKLKGLRENSYSDRLTLTGELEPDADNIVTLPANTYGNSVNIHIGAITQDTIELTWKQKWSTVDDSAKHILLSSDSNYFPTVVAFWGFDFWYPNKQAAVGTRPSTNWTTFNISLNKVTGATHYTVTDDVTGDVYFDNSGHNNTNTSDSVDITARIMCSYNEEGTDYPGPEVQVDLSSIVLTLDGVEHRMVESGISDIEVDSLVVPADIVDEGVAQLKQANADDLGLVRVDEEFNDESDNPIQNRLVAPSASTFISCYNTFYINADGSGDFATLDDAINNFLEGKWSSGVVHFELGEGTFDTNGIVYSSCLRTNIPRLEIHGQGVNSTIINFIGEDETDIAINIWEGNFVINDLTIRNDSQQEHPLGISTGDGNGSLIINAIKIEGFDVGLWLYDGFVSSLDSVSFENCNRGINAEAGSASIRTAITFKNITECALHTWFGGRISLCYTTVNTQNVEALFNFEGEDFGAWTPRGYIGGEYTEVPIE